MRFAVFALFSVILTGVASFTVPEGQPDGTYLVSYEDGVEKHTLIKVHDNNTTIQPRSPSELIVNRQIGGGFNRMGCAGYALTPSESNLADYYLDASCGTGTAVAGFHGYYTTVGCSVSYFCNFSYGVDFCFAAEGQAAWSGINTWCGAYGAGWDIFSTNSRSNSYGHENFCRPGYSFCSHI